MSYWEAERKHCPQGHPYSGSNLYQRKDNRRGCKECRRDANRRWRRRKAEAQWRTTA